MKKRKSGFKEITVSLLCTALLFGCSNAEPKVTDSSQTKAESLNTIGNKKIIDVIKEKVTYEKEDVYSDWKNEKYTSIQLNGTAAKAEGDGEVLIDGSTMTIKTAGTYVISGKLDDGQINIDTEDKDTVRLVLNGANITSSNNAPIYVKNADKTVISLQEGTENHLSDGTKYVYEDSSEDEPDAAIFSKSDLTINGSGKLIVNGNYNNGIATKDELRITGGNIQIDAADDGLIGKDLVAVKDGSITINAGGDGIKSTNDKDSSKGIIAAEGGTFNIKSGNDGIQAETSLLIADGDFTISSGGGSPETIANREGAMPRPGQEQDNTAAESTDTEAESAKGLKAGVEIAIGGGTLEIDSSDDAVHSNNSITITDGDLNIASGDDGIHADSSILTKGGNINITKSYEGIESKAITIAEGDIHVKASDDGINIGGGNDGSGMDMQADAEDSMLTISGGYVYVDSQGDGLDSNGSISMTDGTVIVNGPAMNGNGSLDYDKSFKMSGGFLIAAGSSGMAQAASEESTQNSVLMTFSNTKSAGTAVHLEDSKGNEIATFTPEKDYQSVFISSPKLKKDTSYTMYSGGSSTGNEKDGLYTGGEYKDGTKVVEFKISDSVTWLDESGVTTAKSSPGGMGNRGDGQARSEKGTPPSDMFGDLDDETKEKAQAIMEKERAGTITREEAQAQLKELGIEFPGQK
ncbi:carbohydrate-binding domain-containing protein [Metabacillus fastidiosus]|uniref:carbohydrate-binding domain-containing protein n=1 Tax=Metabacillus fastidiosus TaxID=1458 RepID=UPI002DB87D9E|nr:carbohydrate-binding domain-containing protein [Metabacillus fastidiosus]MEC2076321.1 carbohydrate-binding domain-containing protein [Metabacillus fastidiosus]